MLKYSIAENYTRDNSRRALLCNFLIKSFLNSKVSHHETFVGRVLKKELKILHILHAAFVGDDMILCYWKFKAAFFSEVILQKAHHVLVRQRLLKLNWLTSLLRPNPFLIHLQTYVHWESTQDPVEKQIVGDFLYIQTSETRTRYK